MIIIKLAQIRYLHNISLRELEQLCGIGKTTLNNIENDKISPTLFELEKIAIALKIKIEDL